MGNPLVTCIMATMPGRPQFQPSAIDCWLSQTYEPRELLIVGEPDQDASEYIPAIMQDQRIRLARMPKPLCLGEKRNVACALASGSLIAIWDDDDWSAPRRLEEQVAFREAYVLQVCGFSECMFWDTRDETAWRFHTFKPWIPIGGSLLFRRDWWLRHEFPYLRVGEDEKFIHEAGQHRCQGFDGNHLMVMRNHPASATGRRLRDDGNQVRLADKSEIPAAFWYSSTIPQTTQLGI